MLKKHYIVPKNYTMSVKFYTFYVVLVLHYGAFNTLSVVLIHLDYTESVNNKVSFQCIFTLF